MAVAIIEDRIRSPFVLDAGSSRGAAAPPKSTIEKLVVTHYGRLSTVWTLCATLVALCGCAGGPGGLTSGKLAVHAPHGALAADDQLVVQVPTAVFLFPNDLSSPAPEAWIRRSYNLTQRQVSDRGGHFPAMENGEMLVADMTKFFARYRD